MFRLSHTQRRVRVVSSKYMQEPDVVCKEGVSCGRRLAVCGVRPSTTSSAVPRPQGEANAPQRLGENRAERHPSRGRRAQPAELRRYEGVSSERNTSRRRQSLVWLGGRGKMRTAICSVRGVKRCIIYLYRRREKKKHAAFFWGDLFFWGGRSDRSKSDYFRGGGSEGGVGAGAVNTGGRSGKCNALAV